MGSAADLKSKDSFDQILKAHVDCPSPALHNASFCAIGKEGKSSAPLEPSCILYSAAFGSRDLQKVHPNTLDTFFWIGSLTKLSTAIACLIAVEKGLITLDQNVREIVPELADLDVFEGLDDDGTPRLRKAVAPISLRQLLSHTSGFTYDKFHPGLSQWLTYTGKEPSVDAGSLQEFRRPLIFEPGQGWAYGQGVDWAGRTIEVVAGQDLESFMQANIWTPLKMESTTFRPWKRPDLMSKLVDLADRGPDGNLTKGKVPLRFPATDCCGGVGLYSTPADQAKLLSAVLAGGAQILSQDSIDELTRPQLADPSHFIDMVSRPNRAYVGQMWPMGAKGSCGLTSSINGEDFPGRRPAESVNWQGIPGIHTWVDRKTGLGGIFVTQIMPPGDAVVKKCFYALEEATYNLYGGRAGDSKANLA